MNKCGMNGRKGGFALRVETVCGRGKKAEQYSFMCGVH